LSQLPFVVASFGLVALSPPGLVQHPAGSTLADRQRLLNMPDRLPPTRRA
jgi:hypothetical protein